MQRKRLAYLRRSRWKKGSTVSIDMFEIIVNKAYLTKLGLRLELGMSHCGWEIAKL